MRRTAVLWEAFVTRKGRLTADEAGELLGMSARHFRRLRARYAEAGAEGLRIGAWAAYRAVARRRAS